MSYKKIVRPVMFTFDPEKVHDFTLQILRLVSNIPILLDFLRWIYSAHSHHGEGVNAFGLRFSNPVGLAAGYDKDGIAWRGLSALGFGHLEIGTVTLEPQDGNPKPRIWRIPDEKAIINRMGFPGYGAEFVFRQLSKRNNGKYPPIIGVNIGKNRDTPNENAAQEYDYLFQKFSPVADYLTINVSSPNTIGLRRLQARDYLEDLLSRLNLTRSMMTIYKPILVKISPDLTWDELDDVLDAINRTNMDGIVATNTTIKRDKLLSPSNNQEGGLSGAPLTMRSRKVVSEIFKRTGGKLPIIGVGGIMNADDAKAMMDVGASLIQVYSGLVFSGPRLVKDILHVLR